MKEIIELVNLISKVQEDDKDAREKLELYWRKLFLLEKTLSDEDKKGISLVCHYELMEKNVFVNDFASNFYPSNSLEAILKLIKQDIDYALYSKGLISSLVKDSYYHLCKEVSYIASEELRQREFFSKPVSIIDVGINNISHDFSPVFDGEKLIYIADFSFRQFLLVPFYIPERIYHFREPFLSPASFGNPEFFQELCIKGFFKATPENVKTYFDGFWCASASCQNEDALIRERIKKPNTSGEEYLKQISDIALR